ncbi:tigger transposable element-derived protein 6-like [Corticium candelabrum]|uniref:tigger transposable element-derived protein 6-like n=1 Tax=Corticium candelabrum TaxID=121492 RepID=UPI002E26462D|nr:tigger transposable element-derived protein 6-like [Corticium candelabrum]
MTSDLFQSWLNTVNIKIKSENRSILLFMDNCSAHPHVIRSNVKLVLLPPNNTSRLPPCDAGIIRTVKMHYRKQLLRSILARMDEATCASDLVKSVNILDAIMFLSRDWDAVQPSTITRCFEKCRFVESSVREEENETAGEVNLEMDLQFLVHSADTTWAEYSNCDQKLATSYTEEDVDWEQTALERAVNEDKETQNESDTYVEDDAEAVGDDTSKCLSEREAAVHLHQLRDFAALDNAELLQLISKSQSIVEKLQRTSKMFNIQSRITVFVK